MTERERETSWFDQIPVCFTFLWSLGSWYPKNLATEVVGRADILCAQVWCDFQRLKGIKTVASSGRDACWIFRISFRSCLSPCISTALRLVQSRSALLLYCEWWLPVHWLLHLAFVKKLASPFLVCSLDRMKGKQSPTARGSIQSRNWTPNKDVWHPLHTNKDMVMTAH